MNSYTVLSKYYDKLNYDCDYVKWSQYLYFLLEKYAAAKGRGADAACGSGKLTILLQKSGLDIYGYDISPHMLAASKENAAKSAAEIEFICADISVFKAPKKLKFLNCSCDGINYVGNKSIDKCFKTVYSNLASGGVFLFDISSSYKLKNIIGDNTFSDDTDEVTYIWNNTLEENKIIMDLIFFIREGANYLRFDENHIQYIYEAEFLRQRLLLAGFKQVHVFDFLTLQPPTEKSSRIQFAALK